MKDYQIVTNLEQMDFSVIHGFISESYWAKGIPEKILKKALEHSLCFGVLNGKGELVGFARVITDKATFAYLADVFILEDNRGLGLSKRLMTAIVKHPDLQGLRRMMLATRDAHSLYQSFGFEAIAEPDNLMQCLRQDVYQIG
jgi:N-acetylglutamate synthase-like GNAT family acetyltransferase